MDRPKGTSPAHRVQKLSPKVKLALRALATGAARSNKDAAAMAGVRPEYIAQVKYSDPGVAFMDQQDEMLNKASVNLSGFLRAISAEASVRMVQLMRNAGSEAIQFRAAQDLMDRNPEISKVQKHTVETLSIDGADAKRLAEALVHSATLKEKFLDAATGDFVKVDIARKEIPHELEQRGDRAGESEADVEGDAPGV